MCWWVFLNTLLWWNAGFTLTARKRGPNHSTGWGQDIHVHIALVSMCSWLVSLGITWLLCFLLVPGLFISLNEEGQSWTSRGSHYDCRLHIHFCSRCINQLMYCTDRKKTDCYRRLYREKSCRTYIHSLELLSSQHGWPWPSWGANCECDLGMWCGFWRHL